MSLYRALLVYGCLACTANLSMAENIADYAVQQCGSCHALQPPGTHSPGIIERKQRLAPPLYYAGNKFREAWLVEWLQKPERIRPAGEFPASHVTSKTGEDVIDAASLPVHPAVDAGTATALAAYLMTRKASDELVANSPYQDGTIALRMGQMNFGKFKGCDGCHQDAPGYGGVSGPVLYNAWQRLTPAFIASFIKDPVAWDPHTLMPHTEMNDDAVNKLALYLKAIGGEQP